MDRGAWWTTARGITKSWTQLSNWVCMHLENENRPPCTVSVVIGVISCQFIAIRTFVATWIGNNPVAIGICPLLLCNKSVGYMFPQLDIIFYFLFKLYPIM